MTGQRIRLNNGTVIENGTAGYSDGSLWLYFSGYTMMQAALLFFDTANTAVIVFEYGEMSDTYEGFTNCTSLTTNTDGKVSVCLKRGD